ncbi:SRPBCC family protein [Chitinophaga lutea]
MITKHQTQITKDAAGKKLVLTRSFDAEPEMVWNAFTMRDLLDQWWAPKPWRAESKSMDFREGGSWMYAMVGPQGERHWAKVFYLKIDAPKFFTAKDMFCDEKGQHLPDTPQMEWRNEFAANAEGGTTVTSHISFANDADLQKIVEMGFKEGISLAFENLDELLGKG